MTRPSRPFAFALLSALLFASTGCEDAPADPSTADTLRDAADDTSGIADADTVDDADAVEDTPTDAAPDTSVDTEADIDAADAADAIPDLGPVPDDPRVYDFALGCYTVIAAPPDGGEPQLLVAADSGETFAFAATDSEDASRFFFKPSDLATYLLYDQGGHYLVADESGSFVRQAELLSDILLVDDDYLPGAQWRLEGSVRDGDRFQLRHIASDTYLTMAGVGGALHEAAVVTLVEAEGCTEHPELSLDAIGTVEPRTWEDGSAWGFAEPHTHMMTNFGFGGGGIFHGAPWHPLGVEHALADCARFHGPEGRSDLLGIGTRNRADFSGLLSLVLTGASSTPDHATAGYPEFTDWPDGPGTKTHQVMYYRWLERAYLGGLRLMVQHATSYSVLCELIAGAGIQDVRYSCNDMVAIDRSIAETRRLERYIDAHHGGPGRGWFRIVESPAEARQVINDGKLAVILGIEVSNLFDCVVTPAEGEERCTEEDVVAKLDEYHALGVRVLFPNHKTDNLFTPGDGSRGLFEWANFAETGHYSNLVDDCPEIGPGFDSGAIEFADFNAPRDDYLAPAVEDTSGFAESPLATIFPFVDLLRPNRVDGDFCQGAGLTDLGEFLLLEMMERGIVIDIAHLPRRSFQRALELLADNDYPPTSTHNYHAQGQVYELGGLSVSGFDRCDHPGGDRAAARRARQELIAEAGFLPAEPMSFDMNGLATQPGGRFGDESGCPQPQENPVEYPFTSFGGDITFTAPRVGNRDLDYNTEGLVHVGLLPELVEDLGRTGVDDDQIDALFLTAESYLQLWERAEARAAAIRAAD